MLLKGNKSIEAIENSIIGGRRELLVAMATGTGKTFTTAALIYRLLESKIARRILFLVDRRALAAQAVREFASFNTPRGGKFSQEYQVFSQRFHKEDFDDEERFDPTVLPNEFLTRPQSSHTFVYVSTIQRMTINLLGHERAFGQSREDHDIEEDASRLDIPIHAFDLIIADECHRGYTAQDLSTWREVIQHFDAVKVGLTATPAAHTVSIFGEPVFRYTVEQAVKDGYLVDYEAVAIKSGVRMNGVFLKEGEEVGKIDTETGEEVYDLVEDERAFPAEDVERRITSPVSNRKIVQEIAKYADKHEKETGRFPKILIFASNDIQHISHADQIVSLCREVFNRGDDFVKKITGNPNVDRPLKRIREFRNRQEPMIAVTVDMLSTGVDIPKLEFIVFLRPVKSRILWEQMLGRGTRLCEEINKTHFVIFDCFDGTLIKYFKEVSAFKIEDPQQEPLPISEIIENINQNIDRDYHVNVLVKRLRRIEKNMAGEAREMFAKFIPAGDMGHFAGSLPKSLREDFTGTMKLLKNQDFQRLLTEYPRAKRVFWRALTVHDEVSSYNVDRFGRFDKAEDYLDAFSRFVKENMDKIEALKILIKRPKGWSPDALEGLRQSLKENDFDEKTLCKAHELVSHKALAEIISIVKHAVREEEPILTAEERVDAALAKITDGGTFSTEERQWLSLVRQHLVVNLTLSPRDFDAFPIFQRLGGQGKAQQIFHNRLEALVEQINYAIAT
ncbi:MAG: DEAD/DEAH box helicase family protein [Elusimicrobiota bacterium]